MLVGRPCVFVISPLFRFICHFYMPTWISLVLKKVYHFVLGAFRLQCAVDSMWCKRKKWNTTSPTGWLSVFVRSPRFITHTTINIYTWRICSPWYRMVLFSQTMRNEKKMLSQHIRFFGFRWKILVTLDC